MLKLTAVSVLLCIASALHAQVNSVDFKQIKDLQEVKKKPVMVFIHTDWCNYCGLMKQTFKKDEQISALLNENFYVVFLNAEERRTIVFAGKEFKFKPTGANTGAHELAQALGAIKGNLSYPTICFLNDKNEIIYQYGGFLDSTSLTKTLKIIAKCIN